MLQENDRIRGAGFESKPGAKSLSQQLEEDRKEKKEPSAKNYKYHHLLLGQWFHGLYQQALINTQYGNKFVYADMPMEEYYNHLNATSDRTGITRYNQLREPEGQVGTVLHQQFANTARQAAIETWPHLPDRRNWDAAFKQEFLFRPLHATRIQELFGNEQLHEYAEQQGYGSLPELIAEFVTNPEAVLPANGNDTNGSQGNLNLEKMYAMLRGKRDESIDAYSTETGNRHLQLMQLLAYASSYHFFDFTRDSKIDLNTIDRDLQRAVLAASARADMVGLFTQKGDKESRQLVTNFMRSVNDDHISPYAFACMDSRTLEERVQLVERIQEGSIKLAVIEAKTELRDEKYDETTRQYEPRTFSQNEVPEHHYADFGFTLFAMYQHVARLLNIRPEDIAKNRGLLDFQTGSRHDANPADRQRFREALNHVRGFRDSFFNGNANYIFVRAFGDHIEAAEADRTLIKTAKPSDWYGLKAHMVEDLNLQHSVLPAKDLPLRQSVIYAGEKLARNITNRRKPRMETNQQMLEESI